MKLSIKTIKLIANEARIQSPSEDVELATFLELLGIVEIVLSSEEEEMKQNQDNQP